MQGFNFQNQQPNFNYGSSFYPQQQNQTNTNPNINIQPNVQQNFNPNVQQNFNQNINQNNGQQFNNPNAINPNNISVAPPIQTTNINISMEKLVNVRKELNNILDEKKDIVDILLCAILCKEHVVLLGPPGGGKSFTITQLTKRIVGSNLFSYLLNKNTDPSEILGPFSIKQMENDKYVRIPTGKLPEAHFAFLDEIFKSNGPTLNILLSILNERIFYNDGTPVNVPLISMFGASNEFPEEDEELEALYDRILFRCIVTYIKDRKKRIKMHMNFLNRGKTAIHSTLTLQDIKCLQQACDNVSIDSNVLNSFEDLLIKLKTKDKLEITISDRRSNQCLKAMQAHALLEGRNCVDTSDFKILTSILWQTEEQIPILSRFIADICDPYDDIYKTLNNKVTETLKTIIQTLDGYEDPTEGTDANGMPMKLGKILNSSAASTITTCVGNLNNYILEINNTISNLKKNSKYLKKFDNLKLKCENVRVKMQGFIIG